MRRTINRLNEEIARWAFEIIFKTNKKWTIAFTNPTAGPWKTIKAKSLHDETIGEVFRFALEEDRPDIILYSDELKSIIIFEAKDSLIKLTEKTQSRKSANVVVDLARMLASKGANPFWAGREKYRVYLGLLWGSDGEQESGLAKEELFDQYHELISGKPNVDSSIVIGIETLYKNGSLKCSGFSKVYDRGSVSQANNLISNLIIK